MKNILQEKSLLQLLAMRIESYLGSTAEQNFEAHLRRIFFYTHRHIAIDSNKHVDCR